MIYHMSGGGGTPITPPEPTITIAPSGWTVTSEYSLSRGRVLADTTKSKTVSLPTQSGSAPSISVGSSGLISSSYSVPSGKLLSSGGSSTYQLATQSGYTVTPGTSTVTAVSQGRYTTGNIYVAGDSNLTSANIVSGKTIFGVSGSATVQKQLVDISESVYTHSQQIILYFKANATPVYAFAAWNGYYQVSDASTTTFCINAVGWSGLMGGVGAASAATSPWSGQVIVNNTFLQLTAEVSSNAIVLVSPSYSFITASTWQHAKVYGYL